MSKQGTVRDAAVRPDRGFTVVEAVVAMGVAAVVLLGVALATITAVQATLDSRQNQQAGDLLTQNLEDLRAKPYASLAMSSNPTGGSTYDPGTGTPEPLVVAPTGTVQPVAQPSRNDTVYTVHRYVTSPPDAAGAIYKRVTVVVSWSVHGRQHTRRASSIVAETQRGLPLPRFSLASVGPTAQTKGPGTELIWAFRIINLGARDSWTLSADNGTWTYYADPAQAGISIDTSTATPLATSGGNATTGVLETNQSFYFVAVRTVGDSEPSTTSTTFTATSVAQPNASGAAKTRTVNLTVAGETCPGCTFRTYTLHSTPLGNTATQTFAWMNQVTTVQTSLFDYSTEAGAGEGRLLLRGGAGAAESDRTKVVDFRYQAPGAMSMGGTGPVQAQVRASVGCPVDGSATLTAYVGRSNTNNTLTGFSSYGSASEAVPCTGSFGQVTVNVPVTQFTVGRNKYLETRLQLAEGSTSDVRVAYDAPGYESAVVLPQVSP